MSGEDRFVGVRRFQRPVGRLCMHCRRRATTTATRVIRYGGGSEFRLGVAYCDTHAQVLIAAGDDRAPSRENSAGVPS